MHATPFTAHSQRYYNKVPVLLACKYYRRPKLVLNQRVQPRELTRIARHRARLVARSVYKLVPAYLFTETSYCTRNA